MSRIRSTDTSLEIRVRQHLYSKGFRYRIHANLPGRPDIVFPKQRIAVFVNGCFWHMHGCNLSTVPSTRREFWKEKLQKNRERDLRVRAELSLLGWEAFSLWECEIKSGIDRAVNPLISILRH